MGCFEGNMTHTIYSFYSVLCIACRPFFDSLRLWCRPPRDRYLCTRFWKCNNTFKIPRISYSFSRNALFNERSISSRGISSPFYGLVIIPSCENGHHVTMCWAVLGLFAKIFCLVVMVACSPAQTGIER